MTEFPVFFCATEGAAASLVQSHAICVWPVDLKWNDFGYGFQAQARINSSEPSVAALEFSLLVVPVSGESEIRKRFNLWLDSHQPKGGVIRADELGKQFLSILHSEDEYQRLISWASNEQVPPAAILNPLRDTVFFRAESLEMNTLSTFLSSEAAQKGVFRREPTYLAWHRAFRMLTALKVVDVKDARAEFSFSTSLPGFGGAHEIRFRCGVPQPLSDRCHALIGKNGVGKSQFLRELILTLGRRVDGTTVDPFESDGIMRGKESMLLPETFQVNRVIALSWDSKSAFPPGARLNSQFQYLHYTMRDDAFEPAERVSVGSSDSLASQLMQLYRENVAGSGEGFKRLEATLKPLFDVSELALYDSGGTSPAKWWSLGEIKKANEERQLEVFSRVDPEAQPKRLSKNQELIELSSGERAFLSFGIRCAARVVPGTLLVLDEPETHLHPNLISNFMRVLSATLESTQSIALIATHSPFVIRELPSRCVHVLRIDADRVPQISNAFLRTFGASIDSLASDIFQDTESDQVNLEVAKKLSKLGKSFEEIREIYGRELGLGMLSEIRQLMQEENL